MIDWKLIRENPDKVSEGLLKRGENIDISNLLRLDKQRRETIMEVEHLKSKRNQVSAEIAVLRNKNNATDKLIKEMKDVSANIKMLDLKLAATENKISEIIDLLPNLPDEDVLAGGKENNEVIRTWGVKPEFNYPVIDHIELSEILGLIDHTRGVKISGANFWIYRGAGALLEWGLINYFIESHLRDGYEFILPPHILRYESGYAAGQFPKFAEDVFHISQKETRQTGQFLLPTAETALVNLHRDEIFDEDELPKKYFAYTPCYRKEVGSYRATERGTMRGHQFNKVELFQYTLPEDSDGAHLELLAKAEKLVQGLGLHYQVTQLAAQDMSEAMAKTYDVEIWIPSLSRFSEVSSVSNARDYQARRGMVRFRRSANKKIEYVHTLNGSGLATSRLFVGLVEQLQRADGSIVVPEVLQKWVGKEVIGPLP
jgi:seryl-tRNA synthetase